MPAKDFYHEAVKKSLIKDGWLITHDPYSLKLGSADLFVDLGAEKILAAEKNNERIAVEVKSFLGKSIISEVQDAIGQFIMYREVLTDYDSDRKLFLAVEAEIFNSDFSEALKNLLLERLKIKVLVFDSDSEEVIKWLT